MEKDQAFIIHKSRRWNGHGSLSSVTTRKWATAKNSIVAGTNAQQYRHSKRIGISTGPEPPVNNTGQAPGTAWYRPTSPKSLCKYHVSFSFLFFSFLIFFSSFLPTAPVIANSIITQITILQESQQSQDLISEESKIHHKDHKST